MRRIFASLVIIAAAVSSGCRVPEIAGDTAVVFLDQQPHDLNPVFAADAASQRIAAITHVALVRFDPKMKIVSELASSWKIEGYRKFRFQLKSGVKFHDGSPLDAGHVVESFLRFQHESPNSVVISHVKVVRAEASDVFYLETDQPQPYLLRDLPAVKVFKIVDGRIIGAGQFYPEPGEFKFHRFDSYFEKSHPSALKRIVFRYVRDETTRYQLLMRGDVNVALNALNLSRTLYLKEHLPNGLQLQNSPGLNVSYLCFNFRDSRLAKLKVRQAIAHALDLDQILKYRFGELGYRATGLLAPVLEEYNPHTRKYEFDRAAAERLLDEAGYPRRGSERWRFTLTMKTTPAQYGQDMSALFASSLRQVGIDVRIQTVEEGTFLADIRAGNFQIFQSRWVGVSNPSIYFRVFHSSQIGGGGLNRGAYQSPEMDRLLDLGMVEPNDQKRNRYFSEIQKLAAEDLPYLSLWHWNNTFIGSEDMKNLVMYANGSYLTLTELTR
jgi:peptide/nickel transport system substrate-binding protein